MSKRGVSSLALVVIGGLAASSRGAPAEGPARERRLHLATAEASSYLVNDWNKFQENYLPLYVGDDDPKTAWTLKTEGIGEWLRVHVTPMTGATKIRLKVRNGYQKTDKLWAANSRAHGLTIVLLPSKKTVDVDLADRSGWQEVAVEQPAGALEAIELRVRSVYAGKKYDDLCLSDVQVFVTATTPDNPAFEKQRLQKIADWKKERLEAAKLFQTELGKSLPVAAQYVAEPEPEEASRGEAEARPSTCKESICWMQEEIEELRKSRKASSTGLAKAAELAKTGFVGMTPVRVSTRDKRATPNVDGTCTPTLGGCLEDQCYGRFPLPRLMGYLNAQSIVTTEQTGLPALADVIAMKPDACRRATTATFGWVTRDAAAPDGTPGAIRALLLVECGLVEGREGSFPMSRPLLLSYGADGWLDTYADVGHGATYAWSHDAAGPKLARAVTEGPSFTAATAVAAGK